jgi:protein-disulfide isomerase
MLATCVVVGLSGAAVAATPTPVTTKTAAPLASADVVPDPNANPMLSQYIKDGIKLYYIGSRSGMDGWFLLKDGKIQVVYTTADKQSILIGAMYGVDGTSVTEDAVKDLSAEHPEIAQAVNMALAQTAQASLQPVQQSPMNGANAVGDFAKPLSAGERLVQELRVAAAVDLGDSKAPMIFMIMDPSCPHCKATWKMLRDSVFKNAVQLHLIPIGRNDDAERAAARLLTVPDALHAWDKYVEGDKTQLAGDADPFSLGSIKANRNIIDRWKITETPYLVYRGKDHTVKIVSGEPKKIQTLLDDVAQ